MAPGVRFHFGEPLVKLVFLGGEGHDDPLVAAAAEGKPNSQCFQVFGFDVMLDATGRPWLLEVNLDPALGTESPIDLKIKSNMLLDLLNLVGVPVPSAEEAGETPSAAADDAATATAVQAAAAALETAPSAASGAIADTPAESPASADTIRGADGFTEQEREVLRHVNAEFARSKQGGWRRLFPSPRSHEYECFLDPDRKLHLLPFAR